MRAITPVLVLLMAAAMGCSGPPAEAPQPTAEEQQALTSGATLLPSGVWITPSAALGSTFGPLNPGLSDHPDYIAGQAVTTALSPDGVTLLVLTSGYNRLNDTSGKGSPADSNEYVFVFDTTVDPPAKKQVIEVSNTFDGMAWNPSGQEFYVSGGVDDELHVYAQSVSGWTEAAAIQLGHTAGRGLGNTPASAGVAVNSSGTRALVANFENDSVSLIDLGKRTVLGELDLRPGGGKAGGEYPFWVVFKGDDKAYVTSQRDREVAVLSVTDHGMTVTKRIPTGTQPSKMTLDAAQTRLFVAVGGSDRIGVVDTATDQVVEHFGTLAPHQLFANPSGWRGANPNSLALSPDEQTLYVTNGGTNSVAVIDLAQHRVAGLIPTGWYPNSVSVSRDGAHLWVVNGKSIAGPNPGACLDVSMDQAACNARNHYVWQQTKAGFLSLPTPSAWQLVPLSWQVAWNNHFSSVHPWDQLVMQFLRSRIQHVMYIVKENRTYDQLLGDLPGADGDPTLTVFPEPITPNHHALASEFVTLDRFFDAGEVSGDGWNWTTAARTTDFTEKTVPVNYAGRGLVYDWEGTNRNINVAYPTLAQRLAANPLTPNDPDLLPGTVDVAEPEGAFGVGPQYLWDAALQSGHTLRNYGFFGDLAPYSIPTGATGFVPLDRDPAALGHMVFFPAKPALMTTSDPYFRGFDMRLADFWREQEWEREFDAQLSSSSVPALTLLRLPHDHFGSFTTALDGVDTPDTQMADNDYAIGRVVEKVSHSSVANSTLIFILEDDAQNGGDHVDAHRSVGYVVGPYVRRHAVVSTAYDTVNLVRTIEDVLGLPHLGITDGLARPMAEVFQPLLWANDWRYQAKVPGVLRTTSLPLPAPPAGTTLTIPQPRHDARWWGHAMRNQNFSREDDLDTDDFNRTLERGLRGPGGAL
jgi:YVTN family beta-propeller protein